MSVVIIHYMEVTMSTSAPCEEVTRKGKENQDHVSFELKASADESKKKKNKKIKKTRKEKKKK